MTFLLLVTWLASGQPPSNYQVPFSSNEACEAARLQLIKDAERIGQAMIERASAQDRQIGGNNKTALLMAAISNAPYVSAVLCSNEHKLDGMWPKTWGRPEERIGRRLSQAEAKRLLAKFSP